MNESSPESPAKEQPGEQNAAPQENEARVRGSHEPSLAADAPAVAAPDAAAMVKRLHDEAPMTNAELADKYALEGWIDINELDNSGEWQQIIAALRPSDKVLVPREPTETMQRAMHEAITDGILINDDSMRSIRHAYRAMLAAAETGGHHD